MIDVYLQRNFRIISSIWFISAVIGIGVLNSTCIQIEASSSGSIEAALNFPQQAEVRSDEVVISENAKKVFDDYKICDYEGILLENRSYVSFEPQLIPTLGEENIDTVKYFKAGDLSLEEIKMRFEEFVNANLLYEGDVCIGEAQGDVQANNDNKYSLIALCKPGLTMLYEDQKYKCVLELPTNEEVENEIRNNLEESKKHNTEETAKISDYDKLTSDEKTHLIELMDEKSLHGDQISIIDNSDDLNLYYKELISACNMEQAYSDKSILEGSIERLIPVGDIIVDLYVEDGDTCYKDNDLPYKISEPYASCSRKTGVFYDSSRSGNFYLNSNCQPNFVYVDLYRIDTDDQNICKPAGKKLIDIQSFRNAISNDGYIYIDGTNFYFKSHQEGSDSDACYAPENKYCVYEFGAEDCTYEDMRLAKSSLRYIIHSVGNLEERVTNKAWGDLVNPTGNFSKEKGLFSALLFQNNGFDEYKNVYLKEMYFINEENTCELLLYPITPREFLRIFPDSQENENDFTSNNTAIFSVMDEWGNWETKELYKDQKNCKLIADYLLSQNQDSQGEPDDQGVGEDKGQDLSGISNKVLASSDFDLEGSGGYSFFVNGELSVSKEVIINNQNLEVKLFNDVNGNKIKDAEESYIDNSQDSFEVEIKKDYSVMEYTFDSGWNLIHVPLALEECCNSISQLLIELKNQGISIVNAASFKNGQFRIFNLREGGSSFGEDFPIYPGMGVFVLNNGLSKSATINGLELNESVPIVLDNGWNLVGIYSIDQNYSANTLLDAFAEVEAKVTTISTYGSGMYQSVIQEEEDLFGSNFNIIDKRGYFIKVESVDNGRKAIRITP